MHLDFFLLHFKELTLDFTMLLDGGSDVSLTLASSPRLSEEGKGAPSKQPDERGERLEELWKG